MEMNEYDVEVTSERKESKLGECSADLSRIEERLDKLEETLSKLLEHIKSSSSSPSSSRARKRKKYDCEELLKVGEECKLEPEEKKAFVMCYLQKGLKEGKVKDKGERMKEAWKILKKCQ